MQSWVHFHTKNKTCNNSIFTNFHGIFGEYFSQVRDSWGGGSNELGNMRNYQAELREETHKKNFNKKTIERALYQYCFAQYLLLFIYSFPS